MGGFGWSGGLDWIDEGVAFPGMGLFWFGLSTDNVNWLRFWLSVLDCVWFSSEEGFRSMSWKAARAGLAKSKKEGEKRKKDRNCKAV
jgi:hypothetical protein